MNLPRVSLNFCPAVEIYDLSYIHLSYLHGVPLYQLCSICWLLMGWFYWNVPAVTKMWICVILFTWLKFSLEVAVLFFPLSLQAVGVFQVTWNDRGGAMVWSQTTVHIWIWLLQMNQILADQPISCFLKYEKNTIAFSCHKHILSTVYFWEITELIDFSAFGKIRCVSSLSLMGRGEIYLRVLDWTAFIEFRADLWLCLGPDPFRLNIVVESSLLNRDRQRGRH